MSARPRSNTTETDCLKCAGKIAPYAGRPVSAYGSKFAHHPGQCVDRDELARDLHKLAVQTTMFAASCRMINPDASYDDQAICEFATTDRQAWTGHMRTEHKTYPLKSEKPIRLRKSAPAARLAPVEIPPFKYVRWTHRTYSEWQPDVGQTCTETEMRGQFWANGPDPHSVWVLPITASGAYVPPVTLYLAGGQAYQSWSDAKSARREVNRRHSLAA